MAKTIFEEMGGTYTQNGDYFLPDLKLPEEEQQPIGVWGQRHRRYLKEHRKATYATLLTSGRLNSYLAEIDRQAEEMFLRLVNQMAEAEGVTEELKAADPMAWVGKMNSVRSRAAETVNETMVYGYRTSYPVPIREVAEPPKIFWKYYDLYRRKRMSLSEYAAATGLSAFEIRHYLMDIVEKESKPIEKPKQI